MRRIKLCSLFVTGCALAIPVAAHADPKADAQSHIAAAMTAHDRGEFEVAATELKAAYDLDPQPDLLYAIGQVYLQLDRCADAVPYYQRYLASGPPAQATADTREAIATCEKHAPVEGTSAAGADPTGTGAPPPPDPSRHPIAEPVTRPPSTRERAWYTDPLGDALLGGGVVLAAVGLVVYAGARSDLDDAEHASSLAAYDDLVDHAHGRRTLSVVLVGAGTALVVGGVARLVVHRGAHERASVALVPDAHGGLVTLGGQF